MATTWDRETHGLRSAIVKIVERGSSGRKGFSVQIFVGVSENTINARQCGAASVILRTG